MLTWWSYWCGCNVPWWFWGTFSFAEWWRSFFCLPDQYDRCKVLLGPAYNEDIWYDFWCRYASDVCVCVHSSLWLHQIAWLSMRLSQRPSSLCLYLSTVSNVSSWYTYLCIPEAAKALLLQSQYVCMYKRSASRNLRYDMACVKTRMMFLTFVRQSVYRTFLPSLKTRSCHSWLSSIALPDRFGNLRAPWIAVSLHSLYFLKDFISKLYQLRDVACQERSDTCMEKVAILVHIRNGKTEH